MIVFTRSSENDDINQQVAYVVWNSVRPNRTPLLNAQGEINDAQLDRGHKLVAAYASIPLIHIVHHQPSLPTTSKWTGMNWTAAGMLMMRRRNLSNGWQPVVLKPFCYTDIIIGRLMEHSAAVPST